MRKRASRTQGMPTGFSKGLSDYFRGVVWIDDRVVAWTSGELYLRV